MWRGGKCVAWREVCGVEGSVWCRGKCVVWREVCGGREVCGWRGKCDSTYTACFLLCAGMLPNCSGEEKEFVTPVYAVEGLNATFYCPCSSLSMNCQHVWYTHPEIPPVYKDNLTLLNVSRNFLGHCVICWRGGDGDYYLYNITEVAAQGG